MPYHISYDITISLLRNGRKGIYISIFLRNYSVQLRATLQYGNWCMSHESEVSSVTSYFNAKKQNWNDLKSKLLVCIIVDYLLALTWIMILANTIKIISCGNAMLVTLTNKQLEMYASIRIVATDALVLKHQGISIHNADGPLPGMYSIGPVLHKILPSYWTTSPVLHLTKYYLYIEQHYQLKSYLG